MLLQHITLEKRVTVTLTLSCEVIIVVMMTSHGRGRWMRVLQQVKLKALQSLC